MLDTAFERFLGDIGNPKTWSFPVVYRIVHEVTPKEIIDLTTSDTLELFKKSADELVDQGVGGITTTCGFLGLYQSELASHCPVPVATSSLLQIPTVRQLLAPGKQVGILTYSKNALKPAILNTLGIENEIPILGIPEHSLFYRWIMYGLDDVNYEALRDDVVALARQMQQHHPEVGALVCECTNLSPFVQDIRRETGLPVYDMITLLNWFQASLPTASRTL